MKTNEFYLPILDKVTIYDYSLYKCPFEIDFSSKLNIIYGTNGIGKSTLLMIILFSIIVIAIFFLFIMEKLILDLGELLKIKTH